MSEANLLISILGLPSSLINLVKHSLTLYDNGKQYSAYYEIGKKSFTFAVANQYTWR